MFFVVENRPYPIQLISDIQQHQIDHLTDNLVVEFANPKEIRFKFVGLIGLPNQILFCLPKIYDTLIDHSDQVKKARLILSVLKKFHASNILYDDVDFIDTSLMDAVTSEFVIADKLLSDFLASGILKRKISTEVTNGSGEINWDRTVSETHPFFSRNAPVYSDTFTHVVEENSEELISELHRWAITSCLEKYGEILGYDISFEWNMRSLSELGPIEFLNSVVRNELSRTYIDAEIRTLNFISQLINLTPESNSDALWMYGSRSFHSVWERVSFSVFQNDTERLAKIIPKPKWHNTAGDFLYKDSLRPDIIIEHIDSNSMAIVDAKYYDIQLSESPFTIENNPGISDVIKQFVYESMFDSYCKASNISVRYNVFLFPCSKLMNKIDFIGRITFEEAFGAKEILIAQVPDEMVFRFYLNNHVFKKETLLNRIKQFEAG